MKTHRRRTRAAAYALVAALSAAGCAAGCSVGVQDDPVALAPPPLVPSQSPTRADTSTPVVAPYPVEDPHRATAVAARPTTGSGIVTYADPRGIIGSACTLGFFARYPTGNVVAFTAGHCADSARRANPDAAPVARYFTSPTRSAPFGEYIKAVRNPLGQDIAIIQVLGDDVRPVAGAIGPVTGISTADQLRMGRPAICIVGARTGRSCGALVDVRGTRVTWAGIPAVEGDSGGPVYARWPDGGFTAVGVVNSVHTRPDGTGTGGGTGTLIADDVAVNRMTLMGTA